jgi:S1-C subfamily serine protease
MTSKRLFLVPFLSALVGGAVVVAVLAATGNLHSKTKTITRVEQVSAVPASSDASNKGEGLSAHQIYERDAPSVVFVKSSVVRQSESPFGLESQQQGTDSGSGFVINSNGTILTNWHVVENAVKVTVSFGEGGKEITATVVGKDPSKDLAVLRIPTEGLTLHPLHLGDSSSVEVGETVLAIGNPFDLERTLTTGVISALQRQITAPNGFQITNVLQTDAPINPGNSGGPLLNTRGEVIGINSQIETAGTDGNIGIGFAIPIDTAKAELPELQKGGTVSGAYLGVSTTTINNSLSALNLPVSEGALVQEVKSGTPADKAGIRGGNIKAEVGGGAVEVGGDIIIGVDGKRVTSSEDLARDIEAHKPGETVTVELDHPTGNGNGYEHRSVKAKLTTRPSSLESSRSGSSAEGEAPEG